VKSTDTQSTPSIQRAFAGLLLVAGLAGSSAGLFFFAHGAPFGTWSRAAGLGLLSLVLAGDVWMTRKVERASHIILAFTLLATVTSVWGRGTTSSLLPLLVAPCPVAATTTGPRAGRAWLAASIVVLILAILRNPGLDTPLEVALAIDTTLAIIVVGGVTLAFQARATAQQERLARANAELARKEAVAREANRAKSTFLATMSHEIRTPLNAVIGLAELLGERPLPEEDLADVRQIKEAGGLLLGLLDDVLDLSRIESGTSDYTPVPVHLEDLLARVTTALRQRAQAKGVALELSVDAHVPTGVSLDPNRVRQILVNLVGNAIKFTSEGSVRVEVTAPFPDRLRIDVVDTGVGVPELARAQIFDEFRQADEGRDRAFGGSGLGLAISRRLAEMMQGSLTLAQSVEGVGSTFRVELPLIAVASPTTPPAKSDRPFQGMHVLVVDDDPVNRAVVEAQLEFCACTSEVATNGAEAVARIESEGRPIDLVLMDQQMPVMDGIEATRTLRRGGYALPIVALTANAFAEDRTECLNAGMDAFLTKPISREALRSTLASLAAPTR